MTYPHRYNLYYVPEFPLDQLEFWREPERELEKFISTIREHIRQFGLQNPPTVCRWQGRYDVRPGKCRVRAYRELGHDSIPVVLWDRDMTDIRTLPEGSVRLPFDRQHIQDTYYSGDCVVEMDRRFFNVKKNVDVVNRPGQENQFARELREWEHNTT